MQAGKECRKLGNAELASVLDSDANGRLAEILNGNTWIGGQNNVREQSFLFAGSRNNEIIEINQSFVNRKVEAY